MCGRFSFAVPQSEAEKEFFIDRVIKPYDVTYNASPGHFVPIVKKFSDETVLDTYKWGLIPHWSKDAEIGNRIINARVETISKKPSFKPAFYSQRCLILADGFFEWRKEGGEKIPYYFKLKSRNLFGFAGLYENWKSPEGDLIKSCTIITVEANRIVRDVHGRMPAILEKDNEKKWIDTEEKTKEKLLSLLTPYEPSLMESFEVSRLVNTPTNNFKEILYPVNKKETGLLKFM